MGMLSLLVDYGASFETAFLALHNLERLLAVTSA